VLVYNGRLYDGVHCRRRGETALSWKKPKLKFILPREVRGGGAARQHGSMVVPA
jgi:hypothetical protein